MLYRRYFKRLLDFSVALVLIFLTFPLILITTVILFIMNKGKVFFIQLRPGKNGKIFAIIKFKTMNENRNSNGELLSDFERTTLIGGFLRKSSLDELPQLFNVLRGNLSLIGPRPLLVEYLPLYNTFQKRRHEVRPGITGWAQINGRNTISWEEKFKLDIWYIDHLSFSLDIKILVMTVLRVFIAEDINSTNSITMKKFTGSSN